MSVVLGNVLQYRGDFLNLEATASDLYNRFVYRSEAQSDAVRQLLFDTDQSEFSTGVSRLLLVDGAPAAMVSGLPGPKLGMSRLRCTLCLARSGVLDDPDVSKRLQLAGGLLLKPLATDFYLSRIAVSVTHRGMGLALELMQICLAWAVDQGASRVVLEVDPANHRAMRFTRRSVLRN